MDDREDIAGDARTYNVVSLFSGSMGLDLGLARTGRFRHLACVEMDPTCCETIRVNRDAGRIRPGRLYQADIESLDPRRVMRDLGLRPGELDCLVGGPPCQSFSHAGRREGVGDVRGLMLWQMLWDIEAMSPKVWLVENVTGLLSARLSERDRKGSLLERFLRDLPVEYRVDLYKVDAADFGSPQHRQRVFIVGNRCGRTAEFPRATHGPVGSGLSPYRTLKNALEGLSDPEPAYFEFGKMRRAIMDVVPPGGNWRELPPDLARATMGRAAGHGGHTGWWRRLSWDLPCPTLLTRPDQAMTMLCHPDETRPLSVAEYRAVQEFLPDWAVCGSRKQAFRQLGNAVPVRLGCQAGQAIAKLLDGIGAAGGQGGHPRFRTLDLRCRKRASRRPCAGTR